MYAVTTPDRVKAALDYARDLLAKPIVVFDTGWAETLPDWVKAQIRTERLVQLLKHETGKATRAEAVAYLSTASLAQPLNEDWTSIYCWLGTQYASRRGQALPEDAKQAELTTDQKREFDQFLAWLWQKATPVRRNGARPRQESSVRAAQDLQLNLF